MAIQNTSLRFGAKLITRKPVPVQCKLGDSSGFVPAQVWELEEKDLENLKALTASWEQTASGIRNDYITQDVDRMGEQSKRRRIFALIVGRRSLFASTPDFKKIIGLMSTGMNEEELYLSFVEAAPWDRQPHRVVYGVLQAFLSGVLKRFNFKTLSLEPIPNKIDYYNQFFQRLIGQQPSWCQSVRTRSLLSEALIKLMTQPAASQSSQAGQQEHKYMYLGKAEVQALRKRLNEINAQRPIDKKLSADIMQTLGQEEASYRSQHVPVSP